MPRAVPANEIAASGLPRQQLARDGDPRIQMPAGAAAGDHDAQVGHRAGRRSVIRTLRPLHARRRVLRHVQQNAHADQIDQQRRSAGADERQRNALGRHQAEHDADVHERLHRDHRRQPEREKRAEACRARAARRAGRAR